LARKYAALAHESEVRGEHGRAANLYRAALLVLYNIPDPVPEARHERGVPQNDTETRMPSDPTVELDLNEHLGAENSVCPEMTREHA
jgi:hypothetical protein